MTQDRASEMESGATRDEACPDCLLFECKCEPAPRFPRLPWIAGDWKFDYATWLTNRIAKDKERAMRDAARLQEGYDVSAER